MPKIAKGSLTGLEGEGGGFKALANFSTKNTIFFRLLPYSKGGKLFLLLNIFGLYMNKETLF